MDGQMDGQEKWHTEVLAPCKNIHMKTKRKKAFAQKKKKKKKSILIFRQSLPIIAKAFSDFISDNTIIHWVTHKQFYTLFQILNNTGIFRELLVNNITS